MDAPKYGLILPKKRAQNPATISKPSVFGSDSDDDEHKKSNIEDYIKKESKRNLNKIQTQVTLQKALCDDPSVFEYDEVYEEMKEKAEEEGIKTTAAKDRKPRYIESLLKHADKRKRDQERRQQHKIQAEKEADEEAFGDKEQFVTAAYKRKMLEMQEEEENERRQERLEELMDVRKQKDLSGFYRHLLKQQLGEERISDRIAEPLSDIPREAIKPCSSGLQKGQKNYRNRKESLDEKESNPDADDSQVEVSSSSGESDDSGAKDADDSDDESTKRKNASLAQRKEENMSRNEANLLAKFEKRCVSKAFEDAKSRYRERLRVRVGVSVQ